jgi:hypothetical protein
LEEVIVQGLDEKSKHKSDGKMDKTAEDVLKVQKTHLQRYLKQIKKANPTMLPSLVDPVPLLKQGCAGSICRGGANEAAMILRYSAGYFSRHESVLLAIRKFLYPKLALDAPLPIYKAHIDRSNDAMAFEAQAMLEKSLKNY